MTHIIKHTLLPVTLACILLTATSSSANAEDETNWEYTVTNEKKAVITAYHGTDMEIIVPDTLGGCPVVEIGSKVFQDNVDLESVELPQSLERIGQQAFASTRIKNITIPDNTTYVGPYAFSGCTNLRKLELGEGIAEWGTDWGVNGAFQNCTMLSSIIIPEGIKEIGPHTFDGCTLLMEVFLPETIEVVQEGAFKNCELLDTADVYGNIADSAFENCTSLKNITLHNTDTIGASSFAGDTALQQIELPEELTFIGNNCFQGCTKLQEICIPDQVTSVGNYAFADCTQLTSAVIGSSVVEWPLSWGESGAFWGCICLEEVEIKDGVAYLPTSIFRSCTALKTITIPASVASIDQNAFRDCTAMQEVVLNEGLRDIRETAFRDCTALTTATLPSTLHTIGAEAFYNNNLQDVVIGDRVTDIGAYAFAENLELFHVVIGECVENWGVSWGKNSAFENDIALENLEIKDGATYIGPYAFHGCQALKKAEIPITVTGVGAYAFADCAALEQMSMLRGEIGEGAFANCASLVDVSLARITAIGASAFAGDNKVAVLELPDTVISIGGFAFANMEALGSITIPDSVTEIGAKAFQNCTNMTEALIGNNVTSWGKDWGVSGIFMDDTSLTHVVVADKANSLANNMFAGCTSLEIVELPESIVSWSDDLFSNGSDHVTIYGNGPVAEQIALENQVGYKSGTPEQEEISIIIGPELFEDTTDDNAVA